MLYFNCWHVQDAPSPDPAISGWTKLTYTRVTVTPEEWLLNPYSSTASFLEPSLLCTSFPASLPLPHSNVLAFSVPCLRPHLEFPFPAFLVWLSPQLDSPPSSLPRSLCEDSPPITSPVLSLFFIFLNKHLIFHKTLRFPACLLSCFSLIQLFVTLSTNPPGSSVLGFSRQEYWSGLPCPPRGESSWPRDPTSISYVSWIGGQVLYR